MMYQISNFRLVRFFRGPVSEAGVTAVEFALAASVFLTLLLGVIELGRFSFTQAMLFYAAEEGTRWAVVNPRQPRKRPPRNTRLTRTSSRISSNRRSPWPA